MTLASDHPQRLITCHILAIAPQALLPTQQRQKTSFDSVLFARVLSIQLLAWFARGNELSLRFAPVTLPSFPEIALSPRFDPLPTVSTSERAAERVPFDYKSAALDAHMMQRSKTRQRARQWCQQGIRQHEGTDVTGTLKLEYSTQMQKAN